MLFLGFSAGIPLLLIFSSLSLWLREAGAERAAVTYFSWAALGYSFKFVWAPLVDQLPIPGLTRWLGRRRAWILVAQGSIILSILAMASIDPVASESTLGWMALAAVLLGFSSATQDIVIDAYRIESADTELQAMMSATYIAGYRIGMLVAGAGSLFLADWFGTSSEEYVYHAWQSTYQVMALAMMVGVVTTLVIREPQQSQERVSLLGNRDYARFLLLFAISIGAFVCVFYLSGDLAGQFKSTLGQSGWFALLYAFLVEVLRFAVALLIAWMVSRLLVRCGLVDPALIEQTYILPVRDFFNRYGWSLAWILLALIGAYRISDIVLGVISNVFYQDLGFSKSEIAAAVKTFGVLMTIVGGFIGFAPWTHLPNWLHHALEPVLYRGTLVAKTAHFAFGPEMLLVAVATAAALGGWFWARSWFASDNEAPARMAARFPRLHALALAKWRVDEIYNALIITPFHRLCDWAGTFDRWVVDGLVEGTGVGATLTGEILRHVSSGRVRTYAMAIFIGAVGVACWLFIQ